MQRFSLRVMVGLAVVAMVAAACAKPKSATSGTSPSPKASSAKFLACEVTDTGGIDDRSFNASAWKGLQEAHAATGMQIKYLQSTSPSDYTPNIKAFEAEHCGIIVTVGFLMGTATQQAAKADPSQKFAIVDFSYSPPLSNVKALLYDTNQDAFLGGYLAAGMSKTGKVGTFGGMDIPTVTIYMDGYCYGVQYYNKVNHKHVQCLGWNPKTKRGSFTGNFTSQADGATITNSLIGGGADIIFPVAGSVGLGAASAVQSYNRSHPSSKVYMEWVDVDGCVSAPQYCSLFITSVEKGIVTSVKDIAVATMQGKFSGGNYYGTLANGGVTLAPYHDFQHVIPASLQAQISSLKQKIITGAIKVPT